MYVYVLYSEKLKRYYIGETENYEVRFQQHLSKYYPLAYTSKSQDWALKLIIALNLKSEGRIIESYLKKMKSKKFTERLISDEKSKDKFRVAVLQKFGIKIDFVSIS